MHFDIITPEHLTVPIILWPHQAIAVSEALACLKEGHPTLLVSPTGSGKTIIAAEIAKRYPKVLLVAHRREIIEQSRQCGIPAMSILAALRRGPRKVDLLIIDEAHRSAADTYRRLIKRYARSARIGLTATPLRTDGQGLCDAFSRIVACSSMADLVDEGRLVPYRAFEAPDEVLKKLDSVRRRGGDFATGDLSRLMNHPRLVGDVVREYKKNATGRKAVAFAVSVDHSRALAKAFKAAGVRAFHVDGRASGRTRKAALRSLADGAIDVLCNVNLFTEGWDCPSVSCVIMARPTESLTLYLQSVGRGMRASSGKADLVILDHAGNIERHGMPDEHREWSLESDKQKDVREREVAELERVYSLGFDSIEAELEEKRRINAATYTPTEIRALHPFLAKVSRGKLSAFLSYRGITSVAGNNSNTRYPKADIGRLLQDLNQGYSTDECRDLLKGVMHGQVSSFLKRRGVARIPGWSRGLYRKTDVDSLLGPPTYLPAECVELLGVCRQNIARFLKFRGIHRIGATSSARYSKSDIDSLAASRRADNPRA